MLGIRHVGEHVAGIIADALGNLDAIKSASQEVLENIHGVGIEVAAAVAEFFSDANNQRMLQSLTDLGVQPQSEKDNQLGTHLAGKAVVVTGTLSTMSRDQAHALIRQHGGRATSSLSKKTDLLVAGSAAGSKLDKAQKLGVPILDEQAFVALLNS
ncbi:MAG: helix-hairpin-helix domain-containing protein [Myxococcota bacterium]